jgi:hypothetical protein
VLGLVAGFGWDGVVRIERGRERTKKEERRGRYRVKMFVCGIVNVVNLGAGGLCGG